MIYCVVYNGSYTSEQWTHVHVKSRTHIEKTGKHYKREFKKTKTYIIRKDKDSKEERDELSTKISTKLLMNKKRKTVMR